MSDGFGTQVKAERFGTLADGGVVTLYVLTSDEMQLRLITYGARVVGLITKDRDGESGDVTLGYGELKPYVENTNAYFGVIAGRYANRIAKGRFVLDGKTVQTTINDGVNMLHGGVEGFDQRNWEGDVVADGVEFTLVSPDGDQGFPGALAVTVRYTLKGSVVRIAVLGTEQSGHGGEPYESCVLQPGWRGFGNDSGRGVDAGGGCLYAGGGCGGDSYGRDCQRGGDAV